MSKKFFDTCRVLQWLIPALTTFYVVIDKTFNIGAAAPVAAISSGFVALLGVIIQHESSTYFADKKIITGQRTEAEGEE